MNGLFKNKYRIQTTRLPGKDYSDDGYYFVTICTKDRQLFFGEVKDGKMILNDIGKIIAEEWIKTEQIRKDIKLGEWIIMPNHLHGIIIIEQNYRNWVTGNIKNVNMIGGEFVRTVETPRWGVSVERKIETPRRGVSTGHNPHHKPQWKPNSLGSIINQIKSICTKRINTQFPNANFQWQPRYYDHIIRNAKSLENIINYICNNPYNWEQDRNNPRNLWM